MSLHPFPADEPNRPASSLGGASEHDRAALKAAFEAAIVTEPDPAFMSAATAAGYVFLTLPWGCASSDVLMEWLRSPHYNIVPLSIFPVPLTERTGRYALRYGAEHPERFRQILIAWLTPVRSCVKGVLFTSDWQPHLRILAQVCGELGIARFLIPHESPLTEPESYYRDPVSGIGVPAADRVYAHGALQADLFAGRGYPRDRIILTGSPLFDAPEGPVKIKKSAFFKEAGLSLKRQTVLFVTAPTADEPVKKAAVERQRAVVDVLIRFCRERGLQLMVRSASDGTRVLNGRQTAVIRKAKRFHADEDVSVGLFSSAEAARHADIVVSADPVVLFHALLNRKPAVGCAPAGVPALLAGAGVGSARDVEALSEALDQALASMPEPRSEEGWKKITRALCVGKPQGAALSRLRVELVRTAREGVPLLPSPAAGLVQGGLTPVGAAFFPSAHAFHTTLRYLPNLLGVQAFVSEPRVRLAAQVDLFLQWGLAPTRKTEQAEALRMKLHKDRVFLEDGFLRSLSSGLAGAPAISVVVDDLSVYYDARQESRLQRLLNSEVSLSEAQRDYALRAMAFIREKRVSRYNDAPPLPPVAAPGRGVKRRVVLLIDQLRGSPSVSAGLADKNTFALMLKTALWEYRDADIVVKRHPDAVAGLKESYLNDALLAPYRNDKRLTVLNQPCCPHAALERADVVFTVTSAMGFEALMAGKEVHCFGVPYYAGRGVTLDRMKITGRERRRSVEEIFHFAYVELSRYYNPLEGRRCGPLEAAAYLAAQRDVLTGEAAVLPPEAPKAPEPLEEVSFAERTDETLPVTSDEARRQAFLAQDEAAATTTADTPDDESGPLAEVSFAERTDETLPQAGEEARRAAFLGADVSAEAEPKREEAPRPKTFRYGYTSWSAGL